MQRFLPAVALALMVPALAACGNATASSSKPAAASTPIAGAQQVMVKGNDAMKFDPDRLTVKAGQPVQLTFENTGQVIHDWTLSQGVPSRVTALAQGKQSSTVVFTIANPGEYTFVCVQPGHEAAGMKGAIVAE